MKSEPMSMLPVLPCGVPFDAQQGECCATNCTDNMIRQEPDPKLRFLAIQNCRYWADGLLKPTGTGKKKAAAKTRKK